MERSPAVDVAKTLLLDAVGGTGVSRSGADVSIRGERQRQRRIWRLAVWLAVPTAFFWWRIGAGHPIDLFNWPHISFEAFLLIALIVAMIAFVVGPMVIARRSPHTLYRPEQIDVRMDDVVGIDGVKDEVIRSINLFLAHKAFATEMGGTARRGVLFEGAPGTGKTHTAKAMAAEAGVPFLFVSGTSFQSMYYGATAAKIRSYFKVLRKAALANGGAIGFIEEIDAIGGTRNGMSMTSVDGVANSMQWCGTVGSMPTAFVSPSTGAVTNRAVAEGVGGVVNELLVQMQSFDDPMGMQRFWGGAAQRINAYLPPHRQVPAPKPKHANILLIAATNRADSLDAALVRPGRFDRTLTFGLPDQSGRRALVEHFLARKSHSEELDSEHRDALASVTQGFSPVMIEQLFDEALVNAVRRGDNKMNWKDIEGARLTLQIGLGQPVGYTDHETRLIATHEAGHATTAYLVAPKRRLEVLSIIKRRDALGMLAHGDAEEVYTRSRSDLIGLMQIALGGQVAEELFFGDVSTGPSGDLLYATNVAAQMVGAAGMAGTLISYAAIQSTFNDTNIVGKVLADADGRRRVEELLQEQKVVVRGKLEANQHLVAALRDALIDRNELVGKEINAVLDEAKAAGPSAADIDLRAAERAQAARDTVDL